MKITNSTSKSRGPSNERRNVAETEKQLESMKYRLTQENGWWPFLTPKLENATNKTREEAPPLVKQVWSFLEKQLELAEVRDMTVARFVSAANEVTIGGFWREHAKGELRTRRDHEILKFLSPCWEKEFMAGMFGTTATIFGAFVQKILGMPISLLLALYLVYPRYLFNMGPAYMFSRGVETLRVDGYLALLLLTHGELVSFHRLMEYGEPLSMGRVHSSIETYSYKCAAGLKTLLVQYLMMQNRHMTGEDENPTSREEWKKMNRGMPLLTDLCLAMRSDPMGIIRGLEEVVTCIYGPAVTYAFPDPLVTTYRHSVTHLSLISILDGTALNWCQQEVLRARMSNTVLFGKVKDAELIVYNFRGQMQCRMGGKREGPIETYPKFWNLNPLTADGREILRIPAWKECFALVKRELEAIMEKEILPAAMPEFPIVRRMTLGMNSPLVVPSIMARMTTEMEANGGIPLLTDLCLAMRSDPMRMIRGLEEVVTCFYGPAVTYAFPGPLVAAYRNSVVHVSLISVLDGTALNWCRQEVLRARMSNTVLFGKVKDPELVVFNFRGQLQCRMGGKREGAIETYPKFWNLNPLTAEGQEIMRISAWKKSFELVKGS